MEAEPVIDGLQPDWDDLYGFPGMGIGTWLGRRAEEADPVPVARVRQAMWWWAAVPGGVIGNLWDLTARCEDKEAPELLAIMEMRSHLEVFEGYLETFKQWAVRVFVIALIDSALNPGESFGPESPFLHPGKAARGILTLASGVIFAPGVGVLYSLGVIATLDLYGGMLSSLALSLLIYHIAYAAIRDWALCIGALFCG